MTFNGKIMPKPVTGVTQFCSLPPEQVRFYEDNGYLIFKKLFDIPTLNMFRNRFKEIIDMPNASRLYTIEKNPMLYRPNVNPEMYINKIQELLYDEVFQHYSEHPALLQKISGLLGDALTAVNCMLINKPPGTAEHPPHQDLYYFPFRPADKIVTSWTAIDPVHVGNGCLYVVPGSHKIETLFTHKETSKDRKQFFHGILRADIAAPPHKRVHLEMSPGDTVLFHPYLVHGSGENTSQECRKAISTDYANSSCYYIDVRGTPQEDTEVVPKEENCKSGVDPVFINSWRMKSKQVKGIRSHL